MPPRPFLSSFSPSLARRLARTPLRRKAQIQPAPIRSFSSSSSAFALAERPSLHARYIQAGGQELPSPAALSALLARLGLPSNPLLHDDLLACLTHPSYNPVRPDDAGPSPENPSLQNNEMFDVLGNSLMGMFASEHLARKFPLLPTETLKMALTAYVGPTACESVGRELGIGVRFSSSGIVGFGPDKQPASGVAIRWKRTDLRVAPRIEAAHRFSSFTTTTSASDSEAGEELVGEQGADGQRAPKKKGQFEQVIASTVRAFVGLIYQEQGIHAARQFVEAHFLTRHLDLAALFSFHSPMTYLHEVVQRHLIESGVPSGSSAGNIETRVLAQTGVHTHRPLINLGLFLPSGLKLSEGIGASYKMAQHRAATNALLSLFLVRGDQQQRVGSVTPAPSELPSTVHVDFPLDAEGVLIPEAESFRGNGFGGLESVHASSKKTTRQGRAFSAKHIIPV